MHSSLVTGSAAKSMSWFSDPSFPGLATALDVHAMSELLPRVLSSGVADLEMAGLKIVDIRYKRGSHCELLYRLKLRNSTTGRSRRELLRAQLLRVDESSTSPPSRLLARYEARAGNTILSPMMSLPQARMVVYPFPIDPSLPWLFDALDSAIMRQQLNRLWLDRGFTVHDVTVEVLSYTPHARAALLYEVLGEAEAAGRQELRQLVGKMHYSRPAASRFANGWALWCAAEGRIGLAPPVGYAAEVNLTLQEKVDGQRLRDLVDSLSSLPLIRQTAATIATLHGLSLPLSRTRKPRSEADAVHRAAEGLAGVDPGLAGHLADLRNRLAAEIEACTQVAGPVHGDFHFSNLLVDGGRITVIDLDSLAYGDPMVDVGRFLGSLRRRTLLRPGGSSGPDAVEEAFLDAYSILAMVDERRLRLFEASEYLRSAADLSRRQRAGWQERAAALVEQAERAWQAAASAAAWFLNRSLPEDSSLVRDRQRWATDDVYMQAVLAPDVQEAYGAELRVCHTRARHESEHSWRVEYALFGSRDGEPWSLVVEGLAWRGRRGRTLFHSLTTVRPVLEARSEILLLPRPVGHVRTLSMLVVEPPSGGSFSALIGTPAGLEAASRVAHALAAFHDVDLEVGKLRSLEDELSSLRAEVELLAKIRPNLCARAIALLSEIDRACRAGSSRIAPVLHGLHPDDIVCRGERVAVRRVEELGLSEPLIDVGMFLAQLRLMSLERGNAADVAAVADRFRDSYVAAGRVTANGVAAFEAAALLHLACTRAKHDGSGAVGGELLALAEAKLDQAQRD
jgi:aminoglycoside phosphotransferase (APT) family kinase protein